MSMNTEVEHPYIMFKKGNNVIFKPFNPYSETLKKYDATIFKDSELDNSDIIHYLKFKDSSILNVIRPKREIMKSDVHYTDTFRNDDIFYSVGFRYGTSNYDKNILFMRIKFNKNENNNVVYMQNKINSRILNDKKRSLKTVRSNPKNKSIRLYQNKHNQPVKLTPSIIQIEKEIDEFHNKCEDGIVKLNEKLNAEIELQYGLQNGWFDNTIHRLGHKKSSKNTFLKKKAKSVGGIKSRRKLREFPRHKMHS